MLDVVAQLPDLEVIEYFDYGEPFLHKDTIKFLREVRRTRPAARIMTNTNGTVMTPAQIQAISEEALLDRIVFSIDGATTESYRKYRVGGTFSKAFGKLSALANSCRSAGTFAKVPTPGRVQITWQYILFEWNDSDEEIELARKLARSIDVPIEWVITSGFGASKRFLHGSAEAARLMDPPDSYIHMAANADIEDRLKNRAGTDKIHTYSEVQAQCQLLSLPKIHRGEQGVLARIRTAIERRFKYRARFQADETQICAPAGSRVIFNIDIENQTDQAWDASGLNCLRLGVLLKDFDGKTIREMPGTILPSGVAGPGGREAVLVAVNLPEQPGEYRLLIDVVQEWVCWFSERGSHPLICTLRVE